MRFHYLEKTKNEVGRALKESPIVRRLIADQLHAPVRMTDFMTQRQFRRTTLYNVGFKPFDLKFQIAIPVATGKEIVAFGINRDRDFSPTEWRAIPVLFGHLQIAWAAYSAHEKARLAAADVQIAKRIDLKRKYSFTSRELDVLHWLAQGKRDREIAIILGASVRTINHHVASILRRIGAETRTAAVRAVVEGNIGAASS